MELVAVERHVKAVGGVEREIHACWTLQQMEGNGLLQALPVRPRCPVDRKVHELQNQ
jgi:hypothetical protein